MAEISRLCILVETTFSLGLLEGRCSEIGH